MSPIVSPRPNCISPACIVIGTAPSAIAAASNETRVRVEGRS